MIRNDTTGEMLTRRARPVRSLLGQAFGLMLRRRLRDEGWVFLLRWTGDWDVTNVFVLQPIDVVWLDADRRVLKVASLRPWQRRERGAAGTRYLIELPPGAAKASVGDALSWRF